MVSVTAATRGNAAAGTAGQGGAAGGDAVGLGGQRAGVRRVGHLQDDRAEDVDDEQVARAGGVGGRQAGLGEQVEQALVEVQRVRAVHRVPSIRPAAPGCATSRVRRSSARVSRRSRHGRLRSATAAASTRPSIRSTSARSTAALSGKYVYTALGATSTRAAMPLSATFDWPDVLREPA
jgi:hypothetical protein